MIVAMPANREAPFVAREPLDAPYCPPDLPPPRGRPRGPGRPVRDDQGRPLGRAARCAGPSRSWPWIPRPRRSRCSSRRRPGQPRPGRARARRGRPVPGPAGPALHSARRPATRRCWWPAATGSRPSASSARSCVAPRAGRASSTAGAPRGDLQIRDRFERPRRAARAPPPRTAAWATAGGSRRRSRPTSTRAPGPVAPLRLRARARCCTRWRGWPTARGLPGRGEPRPLDGLRHRHLPRLRGAASRGRTRRGRSTAAPAPRARCSTPRRVVWPGETRIRRARRGAARGRSA